MSEAEKIYNVFRKLSAHPDSFEVGKVVEKCVDSVKDLETQLAEQKKEIERLEALVTYAYEEGFEDKRYEDGNIRSKEREICWIDSETRTKLTEARG